MPSMTGLYHTEALMSSSLLDQIAELNQACLMETCIMKSRMCAMPLSIFTTMLHSFTKILLSF